jgi:calcineurin-like phosphoesterase family protein
MSQVYFTSDTHFGHSNIASKNSSKWKEGYRKYNSVDEMNQDIIKTFNQTVKEDDILYHLGDWSFGGFENIKKFRDQVNCRTIHLIFGNHDHHIEESNKLFEGTATYPHELFTTTGHYKEINVGGTIFVLSHYGHRVWHGSHKGWIHLYGHSHDSLPPYGKSMDVGVDTALRMFGKPKPFSATDILDFMDKQPLEFPDHHDLKTNTGKPQGARQRK